MGNMKIYIGSATGTFVSSEITYTTTAIDILTVSEDSGYFLISVQYAEEIAKVQTYMCRFELSDSDRRRL